MILCCKLLNISIEDPRVTVLYLSHFREYSIYLKDGVIAQNIFYCPWCGVKLPGDLRDEWVEILEQEYRIDNPFFIKMEGGDLPKEFLSDEWWKKRNL